MSRSEPETAEYSRYGVAVVVQRERRLLVIRRSRHVIAPGQFCFPGGGIEEGETEEEAVVREMMEELNLVVRPQRRLWRSVTPWRVALAWWLAEIEPDALPLSNPDEVESFHWHTTTEMAELADLLPTNHDFLGALARGEFTLASGESTKNVF